jgi:hypothetical protein
MKILKYTSIILLLGLFGFTDVYASKDVALVLKVSGKAEIKSGSASWKSLRRGTRLHGGDQVRTGDQTLVAIVFTDDKSMLKVRSKSQVTIHGERSKTGIKKRIDMGIGQLWAKVTKGGAGFRIETPTGVAAVKGTEFYVNFGLDGLMEVIGVEGLVQLGGRLGNVNVGAGQKGILEKGKLPLLGKADDIPSWGALTEDEKKIVIEFLDDEGNKKYLKIKFK